MKYELRTNPTISILQITTHPSGHNICNPKFLRLFGISLVKLLPKSFKLDKEFIFPRKYVKGEPSYNSYKINLLAEGKFQSSLEAFEIIVI